MDSSASPPLQLLVGDDMSFDQPMLQSDLLFLDDNGPSSTFTSDGSTCISPEMMNLFIPEDPMAAVFPSSTYTGTGTLPFYPPSPPPSTPSESDDLDLSYDADEVSSPISRSESIDAEQLQELPARKRQRKLPQHIDKRESYSSKDSKHPTNKRIPHNLVERKYRNTLNAEMERLRRAIPHIARLDDDVPGGHSKPSKATILASAVAYIRSMEQERDRLTRRQDELQEALNRTGGRRRLP